MWNKIKELLGLKKPKFDIVKISAAVKEWDEMEKIKRLAAQYPPLLSLNPKRGR